MAPSGRGKAANAAAGPAGSSTNMQRTSTNSSATSSSLAISKCSCGHPHSGPPPGPTKPLSASTALKRQRELRDFAMIDRLLSRIFWLRFYEDAARLYSTRLTLVAKERLPYCVQNIIASGGGPGWACANAGSEEIREYFRMQVQVDLRELEDRIWHISSEWTYTAIRRMAISNGVNVSPSGLRATDLLPLLPLLEAMCDDLENAPASVYQIHPHRAVAATFLNLDLLTNSPFSLAAKKKSLNAPSSLLHIQSLCAHHPSNKCALDSPDSPVWGPGLYRITSSAFDKPGAKGGLSGKIPPHLSPASILFDALFPPSLTKSIKTSGKKSDSKNGAFTDTEMLHAQAELRSILSLGLSRLFIVLFQTAQEFNLRSFGENVNLAFGGSGATGPIEDDDGEFYGGCECCVENYYQSQYGSDKGAIPPPPIPSSSISSAYDDALYDLWKSISKLPYTTPDVNAPKRKSAKRARNGSATASTLPTTEAVQPGLYANARFRGLYSPRPGAGLKAWDTVLHYEAVIREEEEEKSKKEEEKRHEREKYGLKRNEYMAIDGKSQRRGGKGRESVDADGRGGGLLGWNSCHEEDVWDRDLDSGDDFGIEDYFGFINKEKDEELASACRCRRVALRYLIAEEHKEDGNHAFKTGDYDLAIEFYTKAHKSEPRLPIYLLNRAMASLKLNRWSDAELDCSAVLRKHRANAKALWRRAKARRALAQIAGNVDKLIEAERDLIDFLALLPNSHEGYTELAMIRSELCACFECSEQSDTSLFCSTSSTAPPTSCFNRGYRPPTYLNASDATYRALEDTLLSRSADIFGAPPKGWLATPVGSISTKNGKLQTSNPPVKTKTATHPPPSFNVPWFKTTPTGADRKLWQAFVQDFSLIPDSVSSPEDRMPLKFISDHDLPSSTLPNWDLYHVVKAK